jgi:ribosomal-protein-alanine N-acetyltransferase
MILETFRLKLLPLHIDHIADYFRIVRDPEVMKYIRKTSDTIEEAQISLERYTSYAEKAPDLGAWSLYLKDTNEHIGVGVLIHMELKIECGRVEVGYQFRPEHWGQGYAQEVTRCLIDYGFNEVGLDEIYGTIQPGHVVSQAVLLKCGLKPLGQLDVHGGSDAFLIKRE